MIQYTLSEVKLQMSQGQYSNHFYYCLPYPILLLTNPQSCLALLETFEATFFGPSFSSPDQIFCFILSIPFDPISLVLLPSQRALSFADSSISPGLISTKGMFYLTTRQPSSIVGCSPSALPSSIARQYAVALQMHINLIQACQSPQCLKNLAKLSFPPFSSLDTYS